VWFRLREALRSHPTLLAIYATFGLHSLLYQAFIRLEQCAGYTECSVSLAKDIVWSVIWPIYWIAYLGLY
jgi:hypothetical protein